MILRVPRSLGVLVVFMLVNGSAHGANFGFIGAGARSSGLGGAFIGVADDATAIFWNPGGLTHLLKTEFSFVGRYEGSSNQLPASLQALTPDGNSSISLNFASFAYPFDYSGRKRAVLAVSVSSLYDFDSNAKELSANPVGIITSSRRGKLYQLSIGASADVLTGFSVGTALYMHVGGNSLSQSLKDGSGTLLASNDVSNSFLGAFAGGLGVFWDVSSWCHIGVMASIRFSQLNASFTQDLLSSGIRTITQENNHSSSLPMGWGIGVSMNPVDVFLVALDIRNIAWSQYDQDRVKPVYSNGVEAFSDAAQLHLGLEVLLSYNPFSDYPTPLRAGFYTDPLGSQDTSKRGVNATFYTLGTGAIFEWGEISLSTEFGTRESPTLFPGIDGNKESVFRLITSLTYRL